MDRQGSADTGEAITKASRKWNLEETVTRKLYERNPFNILRNKKQHIDCIHEKQQDATKRTLRKQEKSS